MERTDPTRRWDQMDVWSGTKLCKRSTKYTPFVHDRIIQKLRPLLTSMNLSATIWSRYSLPSRLVSAKYPSFYSTEGSSVSAYSKLSPRSAWPSRSHGPSLSQFQPSFSAILFGCIGQSSSSSGGTDASKSFLSTKPRR